MFKHYLKMAIRQILKNKIQYLLSIIGIAVGLLCFSITSYYIRRFNNQFIAWANSDRMANIYVKSAQYGYEDPYIPGEVVQELMGNPITGIGQIAYSYGTAKPIFPYPKRTRKKSRTSAASRMSQKIFRPYSAFKRWKARHRHSNREKYSSANHPRKKYSEQKTLSEKHSISVVQTATRLPSTIPQSAPLSGIFRMGHGKRVTFISWKQPASNQNVNTEIWWSCWIKVFQAKK